MSDDRVLTTEQAAQMVGVGISTIKTWIDSKALPAERATAGGSGRLGWRIKESDLTEFNRRRLISPGNTPTASAMLLTDDDRRADALTLQVIWPDRGEVAPFSPALFDGYADEFRAVTYTASLPTIMGLLLKHQFGRAEVIFGHADLIRGDKANPLVTQKAIEETITHEFIGIGGNTDSVARKLLEYQISGRLRLMAMAPGVVHSKYYLLEGKAGRRVLVGSANLSERAFFGKQGEVLLAYDNHDFMWRIMGRKYEALAALAEKAPLTIRNQIKPAELVSAEDLPVSHIVKKGGPVQVFIPADAAEPAADSDPVYLAIRQSELSQIMGSSLSANLKPNKRGIVEVTPAKLKRVDRDVAALSLEPAKKPPPRLDIVNGRFIYNGREVLASEDPDAVANDAWVITQYFNMMREFGPGAATMQRNYFGFMGWMFFSPFMSMARRERVSESPKNADFNLMALIYGPANSGKSGLVSFLQAAMFGDRTSYSDKGHIKFNPTDLRRQRAQRGALPMFFDDVAGSRFANTRSSETGGETIAKGYDDAQNEGNEYYPCLVVAMNADAREFSTQVRKRSLMVYANQCVPEDDAGLKARLDAAVLPLHHRIGTAFYAEYLERMELRIRGIEPGRWIDFDYLLESTTLIRTMLDENRGKGEDMPRWCQPVGWQQFDESAWDLKRDQLKMQLSDETQTKEYPPPRGKWTQRDNIIFLGVDDYRATLKSNEYPSQIIDDIASHAGVLGFNREATEAMIRRGDGNYKLPDPPSDEPLAPMPQPQPPAPAEPQPPAADSRGRVRRYRRPIRVPAAEPQPQAPVKDDPKPGLLTRLKQAIWSKS